MLNIKCKLQDSAVWLHFVLRFFDWKIISTFFITYFTLIIIHLIYNYMSLRFCLTSIRISNRKFLRSCSVRYYLRSNVWKWINFETNQIVINVSIKMWLYFYWFYWDLWIIITSSMVILSLLFWLKQYSF